MNTPEEKKIQQLLESGQFDSDWYQQTYPDVAITRMSPARHYFLYGQHMNRDPSPEVSTRFLRIAYGISPDQEPIARLETLKRKAAGPVKANPKRVLLAANNVALAGDYVRAIALAEAHLTPDLAHTANILRANAAIAVGNEEAWQTHLNRYLEHFDVAPIRLQGTGSVFDRLACDPLPDITGGPLISVIMPAWNAQNMVRKAAQSILNQTWRNLELLIVDDCSTDGTWAVLQQIAASDSRVKIMRNKINVGPYVSKNIALMQAQGDWFTGQDADDWSLPQRLEKHCSYLLRANGSINASRSYMLRMSERGSCERIAAMSKDKIDGVTQLCAISSFMNMQFFKEKIGFYDCSRFGADNEMLGRVQIASGNETNNFVNISMLCQDLDGSLTNNPLFGIGDRYGTTPGRSMYKTAWQEAHLKFATDILPRYEFPPTLEYFKKPEVAQVAIEKIKVVFEHLVSCGIDKRQIGELY